MMRAGMKRTMQRSVSLLQLKKFVRKTRSTSTQNEVGGGDGKC